MDDRLLDVAGAARFFLDSCHNPDPPIDPVELAAMWDLEVVHAPGPAATIGGFITHDPDREPWQQRFDIAHELGHLAAHHVGLPSTCPTASEIAGAILVPEQDFKRQLSRTAWDLAQLVGRYEVSWEVLARRLPRTVACVATIIDNGDIWYRERSRWVTNQGGPHPKRLEPWEKELVTEAAGSERHVYADNLVTAYSVPSPGYDRVVLVAGVEEWEARTYRAMAAE
ncbi:MAG: ImmA/IrrE family metallo-endopeptidase [Deltaproteobacteria bacterium]|nr:ImmA/IrrE family metallo-endopeptidase [Deltaproteobacteria bacterium]